METNPIEESRFLDLTSWQLHDLAEIDLPESLEEIDLTANRLSKLDERFSLLLHLRKLSLRQNLIDDQAIEPLTHWNTISGMEVSTILCISYMPFKSLVFFIFTLIFCWCFIIGVAFIPI
jgi:protein phosphatase 1 regulatory subunit 7